MGMVVTVTLDLVWKFISPVLEDKLKEKLKKNDSTQIARQRVLKLYTGLDHVQTRSSEFLIAARECVGLVQSKCSKEDYEEASNRLDTCSTELLQASAEMADALDDLYPQLAIHQHELYGEINLHKQGVAVWSGLGLDEIFYNITEGKPEDLQKVIEMEENNYRRIEQCIKDFRAFVAKEFPFTNSF